MLFCVDTFEAFSIARSGTELFDEVLSDRFAFVDEARLDRVRQLLGDIKPGMHYAPIVSPLVGGSDNAENFAQQMPNVHFRTAIATYDALQRE